MRRFFASLLFALAALPATADTITLDRYLTSLENIQRLKLDVAQMVHVHGGTDPIEKLVAAANLPH